MKIHFIILAYLFTFSIFVKGQSTCNRYFSTQLTYHNNSLNEHYDNVAAGNYYHIFHRTNEVVNTDLSVIDIKKPIIIIEGYDILDGESCTNIYNHYINNPDNNFLGTSLKANGYDIITYNISQPTAALQPNAIVFAHFIDFINKNKTGNEELIIMGISMGGLLTRYALTYMEQNNMQHQTKLFLSFDSPQQGAYVPLSMQALLTDPNNITLGVFAGSGELLWLMSCLNSTGTQQMLTHDIRSVSNGYAHPNQKYTDFFNELTSMNTWGGYPVNCKRVGISNGSLKADKLNNGNDLISRMTSGNPAVVFGMVAPYGLYYYSRMLYTAPGIDNWLLLEADDGICVYQSTSSCDLGTNRYFLKSDVIPPEHIPGGYYPWYKILVDNLPSTFGVDWYFMKNSCFISTISALDLNTNDGLLKLSNYSKNQILADSRFDDIWWDLSHDNMLHTSYNSSLRNFIADQIYLSQTDNYAQLDCSISGGYTNSGEKKLHKASNAVTIGQHTVGNGAQLTLKSGSTIILKPGFEVKSGGTFSASIENIHSRDCNLAGNLPQFTPPLRNSTQNNIIQMDTIIDGNLVSLFSTSDQTVSKIISNKSLATQNFSVQGTTMSIFPNPAEDNIIISYSNPKRQIIEIKLVESMSGRILKTIFEGMTNEGSLNIPIDVSYLLNGMYIVTIQTENTIIKEKFIKK